MGLLGEIESLGHYLHLLAVARIQVCLQQVLKRVVDKFVVRLLSLQFLCALLVHVFPS